MKPFFDNKTHVLTEGWFFNLIVLHHQEKSLKKSKILNLQNEAMLLIKTFLIEDPVYNTLLLITESPLLFPLQLAIPSNHWEHHL